MKLKKNIIPFAENEKAMLKKTYMKVIVISWVIQLPRRPVTVRDYFNVGIGTFHRVVDLDIISCSNKSSSRKHTEKEQRKIYNILTNYHLSLVISLTVLKCVY